MGLRRQAVDFAGNAISIEHTVVQFRSDGKQKIVSKDRMKNKSSCRTMPLVPQFRELLLRMQERLGHSSFSTTANIYAHLDTAAKSSSAVKLNRALSIRPGIQASL